MKIKDLIPQDEFINSAKNSNNEIEIEKLTSNYKKADGDTLLFLLPGVSFDTYELVPDYIKSAPLAIVTENPDRFPKTKIPIIQVRSARRAYAFAVSNKEKIRYDELKFIGITGTNGKTSVATMIKSILEYSGIKTGFIGTGKISYGNKTLSERNYSMTSPDPEILYPAIKNMQKEGCEVIVMEVSSHALELSKTDPINFDIGIFTGLSHDHLEFHGSMENYFCSKEKLIMRAKKAIINFDDPWGKRLYEKYIEKSIGVGVVWRSDVYATEVESYGLSGIGYIYKGKNFLTRIKLPLPGIHNIYNSMLAFETAYQMNIKPKEIKNALCELNCIEGRLECIRGAVTVIIDYAHTPHALETLLKTVKAAKDMRQKIILVFGCGGDRDREKRPMMAKIAETYADLVIVTNDNPRNEAEESIISDIVNGFSKNTYGIIYSRKHAIENAIKRAEDNDIVIVAGKGHEKYMIDKNGYHDFDERKIIEEALEKRKGKVAK